MADNHPAGRTCSSEPDPRSASLLRRTRKRRATRSGLERSHCRPEWPVLDHLPGDRIRHRRI